MNDMAQRQCRAGRQGRERHAGADAGRACARPRAQGERNDHGGRRRKGDRCGVEPSAGATGVVVVIDREFDGYFAELARGLAHASLPTRTWSRSRSSPKPTGWMRRSSAASTPRPFPSASSPPTTVRRPTTGRRRPAGENNTNGHSHSFAKGKSQIAKFLNRYGLSFGSQINGQSGGGSPLI